MADDSTGYYLKHLLAGTKPFPDPLIKHEYVPCPPIGFCKVCLSDDLYDGNHITDASADVGG